jgi:hypothetical protein
MIKPNYVAAIGTVIAIALFTEYAVRREESLIGLLIQQLSA